MGVFFAFKAGALRAVARRFAFLTMSLLMAGCGGSQTKSLEPETSNLKPLAVLYGRFIGQHRGQSPASEAEFKEFIKTMNSQDLDSLGVKGADELFISSRDKKPYVVIYGAAAGGPAAGGPAAGGPVPGGPGPPGMPGGVSIVAYEQEGVGGKRFVANSLGAISEVDNEKFHQMVPGAK